MPNLLLQKPSKSSKAKDHFNGFRKKNAELVERRSYGALA